jgi:hypothetical protein
MGKPQRKHDPDQDQDQKQDQAQAQANLQAQLQGQGQGQAQARLQCAVQSLDSKSENDNKNSNEIDQVNNLVDNDTNTSSANYTSGGGGYPGSGFDMDAKAWGGQSKIDAGDIGFNSITMQVAGHDLNDSADTF